MRAKQQLSEHAFFDFRMAHHDTKHVRRGTSVSQVHPGLCVMRDPSMNKVGAAPIIAGGDCRIGSFRLLSWPAPPAPQRWCSGLAPY